jgi:hypothetical protein
MEKGGERVNPQGHQETVFKALFLESTSLQAAIARLQGFKAAKPWKTEDTWTRPYASQPGGP